MSTIGRSSSSTSSRSPQRCPPGKPFPGLPRPIPGRPFPGRPNPITDGFNPKPVDVRPAVDPFHPLQPKPVSVKDGRPAVDPFDLSKFL